MFDFLSQYANYINYFLNILTVCIIIYYLYIFIKDLKTAKEFDDNNITDITDLDAFNEQYNDTNLCKSFMNLSDREKEYFYHLINAQRIKYKNDKPPIIKKIKNVKNQLFLNMIITLLIKQKIGPAFDSLKHNTLLNFINI